MKQFLITVLLLLTACSNLVEPQSESDQTLPDVTKHAWQSLQTHVGRQWTNPRGVGIGFVWEENRNLPPSERPSTEETYLKQGQIFNPYLILNAPKTTTVLVTVLLDYMQIEFELDGKRGLLHEVTIEPGGDLELPMRVDTPEEGMHDLVAIAFTDPYNKTLDPQYRSSMDSRMVGRRTVVFVGQSNHPASTLGRIWLGKAVPPNVNLSLGAAFATASSRGHPSDLDRQLYIAKVTTGTTFDYQIWVSNLYGTRASQYLLILFFDYHQVRVQDKDFLPVYLNPKEEAILDANLKIPEQAGIYQMQLIYVLDPYKSIINQEVESAFVFGSPRIAIEAKP